jgi:hypothetical protein
MLEIADHFEAVHTSSPEAAAQADEIVQEIVELITQAYSEAEMQPPTVDARLEELIVELLTVLDISPTDEVVQSCIMLAKDQQLEAFLSPVAERELTIQELSARLGTDEFLASLKHSFQTAQQISSQFFWVGRSALTAFAMNNG